MACHSNAMHCVNRNGLEDLVSVKSGELRGVLAELERKRREEID